MLNNNQKNENIVIEIINENVNDFEPNYEKLKQKMEEENKKSTSIADVTTDNENN